MWNVKAFPQTTRGGVLPNNPRELRQCLLANPATEVRLPEVEVLLVLSKFNLLQYLIKLIVVFLDAILESGTL
jgi:hypothetical protein